MSCRTRSTESNRLWARAMKGLCRKATILSAWTTAKDSGYTWGVRTLSVCPVEEIAAPVGEVWSLLVNPGKLDLWWDAKVQSVRPIGPMVPGQLIDAVPRGLFKNLHIGFGLAVKEVDHAQHRLSLVASFPLGITDHATISCTSLGASRCRVSFG